MRFWVSAFSFYGILDFLDFIFSEFRPLIFWLSGFWCLDFSFWDFWFLEFCPLELWLLGFWRFGFRDSGWGFWPTRHFDSLGIVAFGIITFGLLAFFCILCSELWLSRFWPVPLWASLRDNSGNTRREEQIKYENSFRQGSAVTDLCSSYSLFFILKNFLRNCKISWDERFGNFHALQWRNFLPIYKFFSAIFQTECIFCHKFVTYIFVFFLLFNSDSFDNIRKCE